MTPGSFMTRFEPPGSKEHGCVCLSFGHVILYPPTQRSQKLHVEHQGETLPNPTSNFSIMFCRKCQSSGPKRGLSEIQVPDCKNTTLRITTWLHFNFRGA